jgi:hypothetical protein
MVDYLPSVVAGPNAMAAPQSDAPIVRTGILDRVLLTRNAAGVHIGVLGCRRPKGTYRQSLIVSILCLIGDSIPWTQPVGRDSDWLAWTLYCAGRYCAGVCDMAFRPRDLADRMAGRRKPDDGYLRETFTLPRDKARSKARDFLSRYPKQAYMSAVDSWRELPDGDIEFTMRRLPSAD